MTTTKSLLIPFNFTGPEVRLVAADWCEDNGLGHLAPALRSTSQPLVIYGRVAYHHAIVLLPKENALVKDIKVAWGCRKRMANVRVALAPIPLFGRHWDGGVLNEYGRYRFNSSSRPSVFRYPQTNPLSSDRETWTPNQGEVLIAGGSYHNKPVTLTIYTHPEDAHRFGFIYVPGF